MYRMSNQRTSHKGRGMGVQVHASDFNLRYGLWIPNEQMKQANTPYTVVFTCTLKLLVKWSVIFSQIIINVIYEEAVGYYLEYLLFAWMIHGFHVEQLMGLAEAGFPIHHQTWYNGIRCSQQLHEAWWPHLC